MSVSLEHQWLDLLYKLKRKFKQKPNLQVLLYIIGVQELGILRQEFSKEEKQDLMHIGICTLMTDEGYFNFLGRDDDGWPHWKELKPLPPIDLETQEVWLKTKILDYFNL